ncbi:MAG: hypothetical protein KUG81_07835 [Gammaproteobacteria bacterium]|nr:hypothetical protein [Gammaproteobacteria bacterium]
MPNDRNTRREFIQEYVQLYGVYTQAFNRTNGWKGHVFQGPYKAFVSEVRGQPAPWLQLRNQVCLSSERHCSE